MRERARRQEEDEEREQSRAEAAEPVVERGGEAEATAAGLGARAVTIGNRVLLGRDVRPGDTAGRATMRHEELHAQQVALGRSTGRAASESEVEAQAVRAERGEDVGVLLPADPARPHLQGGGLLESLSSLFGEEAADPEAAQAELEARATEFLVGLIEKRVPHGKLVVVSAKLGQAFVEGVGRGMERARALSRAGAPDRGDLGGTTVEHQAEREAIQYDRDYKARAAEQLPEVILSGVAAVAGELIEMSVGAVSEKASELLGEWTQPLADGVAKLAHDLAVEALGQYALSDAVEQVAQQASDKAFAAANDALLGALGEASVEWLGTETESREAMEGAGVHPIVASGISTALAAQMSPSTLLRSVDQKVAALQSQGFESRAGRDIVNSLDPAQQASLLQHHEAFKAQMEVVVRKQEELEELGWLSETFTDADEQASAELAAAADRAADHLGDMETIVSTLYDLDFGFDGELEALWSLAIDHREE